MFRRLFVEIKIAMLQVARVSQQGRS